MPPKTAVRALPASPPLISLFTSAEIIPESDSRWEAGIAYEAEACGGPGTGAYAACITSNVTLTPGSDNTELEPIVIWAGDSCSPYGYAARDFQGRARRKLAACESKLVEIQLWRGNLTRAHSLGNPYLADASSAVTVTSAPATPTDALACLEQSLSDCNCGMQGMIHATPEVVTRWIALNLVTRDGNKLYTYLGTVVVPGAGYDGSGPTTPPTNPDVAVDGSVWAYATSMVHLRLGPTVVLPGDQAQALNRTSNTLSYWAQRIVVAGFECCHFAAEINIPTCATGS